MNSAEAESTTTGSAANTDSTTKNTLISACRVWTTFALDSRRPQLDLAAAQTQKNRSNSQLARKHLADETKSFKKAIKTATNAGSDVPPQIASSIENVGKEGRSTIKAYQEEIDNLTRRCKFAETTFLNLYQSLYDLPDPTPALQLSVECLEERDETISVFSRRIAELVEENECLRKKTEDSSFSAATNETSIVESGKSKDETRGVNADLTLNRSDRDELLQLRREVADYEVEFRSLKNQDITIRKLEGRIEQLQESKETEMHDKIDKITEEIVTREGQRVNDALEREAVLERKVESLELELRAERAGRQATQNRIFESDEGLNEMEAAWEAQRTIMVDDAERLRMELHEVKSERDDLRLRVLPEQGPLSSTGTNERMGQVSDLSSVNRAVDFIAEKRAYDAEVSELMMTSSALRDEVKLKDEQILDENRIFKAKLLFVEEDREKLTKTVSELQSCLANFPSSDAIEEMKRELRILKRLEYNAVDADGSDDETERPNVCSDGDELETVLYVRLRRMESDLLKEKRDKSNATNACARLQKELEDVQKETSNRDKLIASLEADLQKAIPFPKPNTGATPKNVSLLISKRESDSSTLQKILDPDSPSVIDPSKLNKMSKESEPANEKQDDDHSVITIVMAQRDRLRARCDSLEVRYALIPIIYVFRNKYMSLSDTNVLIYPL
mmetsp:Transcript_42585/g.51124  ORF Transcript_42585/g.51124 Transcript_42585/m.51124 type:complete len:679 (+) Transcript_42585:33-2069(+)